MPLQSKQKIVSIQECARRTSAARAAGHTVVLAHGVFDLLHIGHLRHLGLARQAGDMLVVSITDDAHVNKGPGRPFFSAPMRAEMLAALDIVDLVVVNKHPTAVPVLETVQPSIYVKGAEYADAARDVTGKIVDEQKAVEAGGGRIVFTEDVVYSSSSLINKFLDIYDPDLRDYLEGARNAGVMDAVSAALDRIARFRVLIVGDAIIDEYQYVRPMGKSPKENMIASRFENKEIFAGGVMAAANHLAGFCREVDIITCLGADESHEDFIRASLKANIRLQAFQRKDAPTTRKCRFVESGYMRKLFEVYHFDDQPLPKDLQRHIDDAISEQASDYDLVIVTDFGHGLIAPSTVEALQKSARFLAVNVQSNSANHGFNLVTKFSRADYVCIDAPEARLAVGDRHGPIESVIRDQLAKRIDTARIIVTHGRQGCVTFDAGAGITHHIPAFTKTVVDTVGAGDAFLSVTSPLVAAGLSIEHAGFVGNAVGAVKVGIIGHRSAVEKPKLVKCITALLK